MKDLPLNLLWLHLNLLQRNEHQPLYYNAEVGKNAFVLIGSDGSRTELRQVNTSALYESADSSHMLFDTNTLVLSLTEGTQLTYELRGGEYKCAKIKDRNGNYITISHSATGRLDTVTDTLGRVLTFNYDGAGLLLLLRSNGIKVHQTIRITGPGLNM